MGSPVITIFVCHGKGTHGTVLCRGGRCSVAVTINRPLTIGELATLLHFAGEQEKEHAKAARRQAAVNEATSERPERSAGSVTGRYNRPH